MIRTSDDAEKLAVAGDVYALLATGDDTGGAYALIEASVPEGGGPPPHVQRDTEVFYVLAGKITFTVEGEDVVAGPGTFVHVPPGTVHAFRNRSSSPARLLIQTQPSGIEAYFREVGEEVSSMDDHRPMTPDQVAVLKAAAPRHGIEILA